MVFLRSRSLASTLFWAVTFVSFPTPSTRSAGAQAPVNVQERGDRDADILRSSVHPAALPATGSQSATARDTTLLEHCKSVFAANAKKNPRFWSQGCRGYTRRYTSSPAGIDEYFGGFKVGNVITLNVAGDGAGLYTELLSDNLWIGTPFGFARLGLGTLVGANNDTSKTTVDQFFQSGGNAILSGAIPFMYWVNMVGYSEENKVARRIDSFITVGVSADVPELNSSVTRPSTSFRIGPQVNLVWSTAKDLFRLFAQADGVAVAGSDGFFRNLTGDESDRPSGMLAAKLAGGVDINKLIRVGASVGWSTLKGVNQSPQLTVQLLP